MPTATTKITLTSTAGGSGPNYRLEWSNDGVNYSESIDCGNISLPSVGSFVTCSIDSTATSLRLTSLNIFCSNSVVESVIVPVPPITGNKELILNVWNKTTESIDYANVNFNFNDSPNIRTLNTTSGFSPPVYYYISGSELAVGKTTIKTKMNITASFTSSNLIFDIDPDVNSTEQRYTISSSFFTDGTPRTGGGVSTPTSRVNSQINADFAFNPTTWATLSLDLTASYTQSVNKNIIIESNNNTSWYAGTASTDDIWVNRFDPWNFKQDEYPSGFKTTSGTRVISGSNNLATNIAWPNGYGRLSVTQSFFLDNVFYSSTNGIFDTRLTTGVSYTPGTINYDNFQTIKSVTTINDAPITGSRRLEYRVKNNTSASIDVLWWAFDFSDTPNFRPATNPSILSGYRYYISASNVPVGDSVYSTIVNFTASLVQPPQDYNLYCDPDDASSVGRYVFDGIIRQDGVSQATFNAISASEFNQFPTASFLNPMTWATCSFELTASLTASAEPTGTLCYEIETVQSAPGECFDCPGYFFSTTDTILHIFDICSGSEIFPPVDLFVESRYSDNSTSSLFIPSGSTGSLIIATSDVQCAPLPSCGEIASPTFLSASVIALTGSITECCV
jgi:hypothetical protein